jgi:hypothetical protein
MPVFLITPLSQNAVQIGAAVSENFAAEDFQAMQNGAGWLVVFRGTSIELSNLIGITSPDGGRPDPGIGSAMVSSVGSYFGLGPTTMWEWLKARFERQA